MANIKNFKGILVYTSNGITYSSTNIDKIAGTSASNILDYVIIDNDITTDTSIINKQLEVAKQIYNKKPSARIWLSSPIYSSTRPLTYNQIKTFLTSLKSKFLSDTIGKNIWKNAVKGIYMNMESVYGTVNYTSSSTLLNNTSIKVANDVSYFVHNSLQTTGTVVNSKLDFLWIPYYGYTTANVDAATVIKNIGHVISRTNIFDIAIIQPTYYFYYTIDSNNNYVSKAETDNQLKANLNGVKSSLIKNSICYRDGVEVYTRASNATATVGFEMEIDYGNNPDSSRKSKAVRYNEYVDTFINYRNKPMCYYAGEKDTLYNKINKINNFYRNTTDTSVLYF